MTVDKTQFTIKVRRVLAEAKQRLAEQLLMADRSYRLGICVGFLIGKGVGPDDFVSEAAYQCVIEVMASLGSWEEIL